MTARTTAENCIQPGALGAVAESLWARDFLKALARSGRGTHWPEWAKPIAGAFRLE